MAEDSRPLLLDARDGQYPHPRDLKHSLLKRVVYGPSPRTYRKTTSLTRFARFISFAVPITFLYASYVVLTSLEFNILDPGSWCLRLPHENWPESKHPIEFWEKIAISYPKADRAKEWSKYYTSGPHLGGQNYTQVLWTKEKFEELGFQAKIETYDIYVNYPLGHRLALLESHNKTTKVKYEASLEEPVLEKDTTSGLKDRIPTFHGYSANGNVTGPLVFANYGTFADYETLLKHNITIKDSIIIAKYGGIFRGLKVKRAQELGALGVIIYSDPGDDFGIVPEEGYEEYPEGPARHHQSVQRGSVQFLSFGPGDPTTPGYPSKPGVPRQDPRNTTPEIPSIPISYDDAIPFLRALNSHGPLAKEIGWSPGGLEYKDVKYNIGPTPPELSVNLYNAQNYTIAPMWNVIATIPGTLGSTEGVVIAGNHRDAWIAGGAGDPNSGSAALLEVAGALAEMRKHGWKPIRDIILASWDGEEYGLLGSTEWVEDHAKYLSENAIAYINLDVGSTGSHFKAAANPLLFDLIHEIAAKTPIGDPSEGKTVANSGWKGSISTLGSGSDYTAFQDFLGIPSSDMGFASEMNDAVWMYHSNYDSFSWMELFGDKGFVHHEAISRVWGLLLLHLSSRDILPMNVTRYAEELQGYLNHIKEGHDGGHHQSIKKTMTLEEFSAQGITKDWLNSESGIELDIYGNPTSFAYSQPEDKHKHKHKHPHHPPKHGHDDFNLCPLPGVFSQLTKDAVHFSDSLEKLKSQTLQYKQTDITDNSSPLSSWLNYIQRLLLWRKISAANKVIRKFDRAWLDEAGLGGGREWFKHIVYAPGRWTGYAGVVLPGLGEAWEDGDVNGWQKAKNVVGEGAKRASKGLSKVKRGC